MENKSKSSLVGIAGAHFVAAELSQRGYVATVTSRNTEGIDVLASNTEGSKTVSIQVKTSGAEQRERFSRSWILSKKHENIFSDNLFYVFVDLKPTNELFVDSKPINEKPDFYIVPSKTVADYVKNMYIEWSKKPSKKGKEHRQTDMRLFEILDEKDVPKFLNRWDLLGL